jgi:2-oxoglutarate dehydrogenase E1 component
LTDAVIFEELVRKKSSPNVFARGAETLIPLLDLAIEKACRQGLVEVVGDGHRGRLNVLANIMNSALGTFLVV